MRVAAALTARAATAEREWQWLQQRGTAVEIADSGARSKKAGEAQR